MKNKLAFGLLGLSALLLVPLFRQSTVVKTEAEGTGMTFTAESPYKTTSIPSIVGTFEAVLEVNSTSTDRLGTIIGNYNTGCASSNLELRNGGKVALWWSDGNGSDVRYDFSSYDIRNKGKVHIAVTADVTGSTVSLYVNGVVQEQATKTLPSFDSYDLPMFIGGDGRSGNAQYLKQSSMYFAAMYDNVRTAAQIASDYASFNADDANLLCAYQLDGATPLSDLSKNKNNLIYDGHIPYDPSTDPDKKGVYFDGEKLYQSRENFEESVMTYEAVVKLPLGYKERAGVIVGTYSGNTPCFNIEINNSGNPRIYTVGSDKVVREFVFKYVDIRCEKQWVHLAIVNDYEYGLVHCYIDGVLKQTGEKSIVPTVPNEALNIGGDNRSGNAQYFKGKISNVALFGEPRTATEIALDANGINDEDEDLLAHYELDGQQEAAFFENKANDKYDIMAISTWIDDTKKPELDPYSYSMAVIGDTQIVNYKYPDAYPGIFDYLLDNKEEKNIKYVMSMGDTTDKNTDAEWARAVEQWGRLDGEIGYSMVRGNHDSSSQFNKYFATDDYHSTFDGQYAIGMVENTFRFLTIGEVQYIIFTLDYGPNDDVLDWVGMVLEEYSDCKAIITTHAYLYRDGTTLDQGDVCPPATTGGYNNGDAMWDKLISLYENIVMVICGHDPCDNIVVTQDEGDYGNTVTQMLVDPQGMDVNDPKGMVCLLHFSEDGSHVEVEYYSTVREQYFRDVNQFKMTLYEGYADPFDAVIDVSKDEKTLGLSFQKDSYKERDSVYFNVNVAEGYEIESVVANGKTLSPVSGGDYAYVFSAKRNNTIAVTTKAKQPAPKESGPNVGLIIGLSIGGVVLAAGAVIAISIIKKKKRK